MIKKHWGLLALLIVLILLVGSYVLVTKKPQSNNGSGNTAASQNKIPGFDKEKVAKIILTSSGKDVVLEKKDNLWKATNTNYVLDQLAVEKITESMANLTPEKTLNAKPEELDKYGLKNPAFKVKVVLSDGTEKEIYLGDKVLVGNSYYLMVKDNPKVFTVPASDAENFSMTLDLLRDRNFATFDTSALSYLKIVPSNERTIEIIPNPDKDADGTQYGIDIYKVIQPYSHPLGVDDKNLQTLVDNIMSLQIVDFVDDNPTDLSKYGLDKPSLEFLAKDKSNNVVHFFVGKAKDNFTSYFKTADSNSVYTINTSVVDVFNVDPFNLINRFIYIVNIKDVDKLILNNNGKVNTLTMTRTTKKAEKEGDKDEVITTYKVDGKEVDESASKNFYQATLEAMVADIENDRKMMEDKPEISLTYFMNNGPDKQVKIDFVSYNDVFYAIFRDGKSEFLVPKSDVQKMLDKFDLVVKK